MNRILAIGSQRTLMCCSRQHHQVTDSLVKNCEHVQEIAMPRAIQHTRLECVICCLQQNSELGVHRFCFSSAHFEERGVKGRYVPLDEVTALCSDLFELV